MTLMLSSSLPCPAAWGSAIAMVLGLHSRPNAHTEDLRLFAKCKYKLGSPLCQAVPRLSARVARQAQQGVVTLPPCEVFHPLKRTPFGLKNTKRSTLAVPTKGTLVQGGGWVSKWGRGSEA